MLPFWSNSLVRVFSRAIVPRGDGVLDRALEAVLPFEVPLELFFTPAAVVIRLVHSCGPHVIPTSCLAMQAIDDALIEAARSMGAGWWTILRRIVLPLFLPGLLAGAVLVFVPVVGAFTEPRILGGRVGTTHGTVIEDRFVAVHNWPLGTALSFVLLAVVLVILAAAAPVLRARMSGRALAWSGRLWLGAVLAFLHAPVAVMAAMSFNASPFYQLPFEGTLTWYRDLAGDAAIRGAASRSLAVALATTVVAATLGTMAALALSRAELRGGRVLGALLLPPIVILRLITGTAMLVVFFGVGLGRGTPAVQLGHVALAIPHVVVDAPGPARPRARGGGALAGAPRLMVARRVTLPHLRPAIAAGALLAFAVGFDQFAVSCFLAEPGDATLPVLIHTAIREGVKPEINAVSTLVIAVSMTLMLTALRLSRQGRDD